MVSTVLWPFERLGQPRRFALDEWVCWGLDRLQDAYSDGSIQIEGPVDELREFWADVIREPGHIEMYDRIMEFTAWVIPRRRGQRHLWGSSACTGLMRVVDEVAATSWEGPQ